MLLAVCHRPPANKMDRVVIVTVARHQSLCILLAGVWTVMLRLTADPMLTWLHGNKVSDSKAACGCRERILLNRPCCREKKKLKNILH